MKIQFHGAAQTVTGSQYLIQINGHNLLLECGLYQGRRQEAMLRNRNLPYQVDKVDAVILSHAHIDHSGNLPNLVKQGFTGRIYGTPATNHLAKIMLLDSGHIQEADSKFMNKKLLRQGEPPIEPIYTIEDAAEVEKHLEDIPYLTEYEPVPGVIARFVDAGHILGSAAVCLDIQEKGRKFRLWFSGDIGRRGLPIIQDPTLPEDADYLIMESTYGDKSHADPEAAYIELRRAVSKTIERRGKVIIPAFAVGRTQEIVYFLHKMMGNGELPGVPVFVDSPLAINASEIFSDHPECFDAETRKLIQHRRHNALFGFDRLTYTRSVEDSKALNDRNDPMIIISASGMAETGRILHHLRNNIENPRNTILIVSWQAPYTLGRRLAERQPEVKIFGDTFECRAEIVTIGGLSAHAGQPFLVEYAKAVKGSVKNIFLVHGEEKPAMMLKEKLVEAGLQDIFYPNRSFNIDLPV